jgi:uncharacterized membrane protein YphA (DoxX/SURF4 family)
MDPVRRIARPLLASIFLAGGLDALRAPRPKVGVAADVAPRVAQHIPGLEDADTETLIRVNGGVQVGAGVLLVLNRLPRLSALALAASLVPTTAAAHRFWELDDPGERARQQVHFFKNLSLLGGLLIALVDSAGMPGITWRARRALDRAGKTTRRTRRTATREVKLARKAARAKLPV